MFGVGLHFSPRELADAQHRPAGRDHPDGDRHPHGLGPGAADGLAGRGGAGAGPVHPQPEGGRADAAAARRLRGALLRGGGHAVRFQHHPARAADAAGHGPDRAGGEDGGGLRHRAAARAGPAGGPDHRCLTGAVGGVQLHPGGHRRHRGRVAGDGARPDPGCGHHQHRAQPLHLQTGLSGRAALGRGGGGEAGGATRVTPRCGLPPA